jgi:itaconyl-CoA hydratase
VRFYEDFAVGDTLTHDGGRTITEADIVWFSLLTMNPHPMHTDVHAPSFAPRDVLTAPATLVLSVALGLSVRDVSWNAVANRSWDGVVFGAPVRAGDSVYAASEVLRCDRDGADSGLVVCRTVGSNQHGDEVVRFDRALSVRAREVA